MPTSDVLIVEQEGFFATVTLNRPQALNAINATVLEDLSNVFQQLADDATVRVILLTGAGNRAFAAGADIRELQQTDTASGRAVADRGQRVFTQIERCGKPVIACLNGLAFGGGLELALACTLRLASDSCLLGLPEAKLGLVPGFGGIYRLVRQIGRSSALRMMLTAQTVTADEGFRLGLLDEVVPAAELLSRARGIGAAMADLAPLALRALLSLVAQEENESSEGAYHLEAELFGQLCGSADKQEGLLAFLEKRQPRWTAK